MSGIYIPNMEMPKGANDCKFSNEFFTCSLTKERCALERMGIDCPLVFVPDHGRLIDADALIADGWDLAKMASEEYNGKHRTYLISKELDDIPTIIPADKEEE